MPLESPAASLRPLESNQKARKGTVSPLFAGQPEAQQRRTGASPNYLRHQSEPAFLLTDF